MDAQIEPIGGGDYDLVITDGDLVLVGHTAATWQQSVKQDLEYTLGTWLGESAFDRSAGFPWRQAVFGTNPIEGIGALVYDYIVSVDGIDGLVQAPVLELDSATGRLSITAEAEGEDFAVPIPVSLEVQAPQ